MIVFVAAMVCIARSATTNLLTGRWPADAHIIVGRIGVERVADVELTEWVRQQPGKRRCRVLRIPQSLNDFYTRALARACQVPGREGTRESAAISVHCAAVYVCRCRRSQSALECWSKYPERPLSAEESRVLPMCYPAKARR